MADWKKSGVLNLKLVLFGLLEIGVLDLFGIWNLEFEIRLKRESEEDYNFIVGDFDIFRGLCQESSAGALGIDRS